MLWLCTLAFAADWTDHIDHTLEAVVSISMAKTRTFDGTSAGRSQATGWVVDAERGLVMTNRHVATPGPTVHRATFYDEEEVDLKVVYRDPVHDFAIMQYDPAELQYAEPPSLVLDVDGAEVGDLIWTAGNDSGEKVVIHESTLARKDRGPPSYDLNTFYWQAATDVAGGGSGSPVLNAKGRVVAIHSGGARGEQSSFHLPLERIARALAHVQRGEAVPRGTLQVVWTYESYEAARELGLTADDEARFRQAFPGRRGMLVVGRVNPKGPADGVLRPGDVLLSVEGAPVSSYIELADALDGNARGTVALEVQRRSVAVQAEVEVDDLHALTPSAYVEFDGNVIHPVGWLRAQRAPRPVAGLTWANRGVTVRASDLPQYAVIRKLDGREVRTLEELEQVLATVSPRQFVTVAYEEWDGVGAVESTTVQVDDVWRLRRACREELGAGWQCRPLAPAPEPDPVRGTVALPRQPQRLARKLAPSLVEVESWVLGPTVGDLRKLTGVGVVADADRGLVFVDRSTVPGHHATVELLFASRLRVPARVAWIHPDHDLAWLRYDTASVGDTEVASATLRPQRYEQQDRVWQVLAQGDVVTSKSTHVTSARLPSVEEPSPPRFQQQGIEMFRLQDARRGAGVLTDRRGRVTGMWTGFSYDLGKKNGTEFLGMPVELIEPSLEALQAGRIPTARTLGLVLRSLTLEDAAQRGVDAAHLEILAEARRPPLVPLVRRRTPGTSGWDQLQDGDLLLELDGAPLVWVLDLYEAVQSGPVRLTVLRDGERVEVEVDGFERKNAAPDRMVDWAGMALHEPHPEVALWAGRELEGLYVSRYWYGGPNHVANMRAALIVTEVNEQPVPTVDALLEVVADIGDRETVTLRSVRLNDHQEQSWTLRMDLTHFPTRDLVLDGDRWRVSE